MFFSMNRGLSMQMRSMRAMRARASVCRRS